MKIHLPLALAPALLPSATAVTAIEFTYRAQLLKWLAIQPSFQTIIHPSGAANLPTAKVLLLRGEASI
ncbi:MAG: carbohydrate porin [Mariprofundales bacterium]|nr:carbohydrate porin [Mariprofundales bacterium]